MFPFVSKVGLVQSKVRCASALVCMILLARELVAEMNLEETYLRLIVQVTVRLTAYGYCIYIASINVYTPGRCGIV